MLKPIAANDTFLSLAAKILTLIQMKKQLLSLLTAGLLVSAASAQTVIFTETFTGQVQPAGWSQDSAGTTPLAPWAFNNPGARVITGAGFDADFAIFDSDILGSGNTQDAILISPTIDASALATVFIVWDEQFRAFTNGYREVFASNDNGVTWTSVLNNNLDNGYPDPAVANAIDITAIAAGQSQVKIAFHYTATWGWWWAIDNVKIQDGIGGCSGTPSPGTASASPAAYCGSNNNISLSTVGFSIGTGITFQWESSPDDITYTPIAGATNSTYAMAVTSPTFFHCVVSCGANTATTLSVSVVENNTLNCYCQAINPVCNGVDIITNVTFNTLNNSSFCDTANTVSNYTPYPSATSPTTTVDAGMAYNLDVTTGEDNIISVWIDYDHNGSYDASEWNQVCLTSVAGTANTVSVAIPSGAFNGLTGMRIRSRLINNQNGAPDACLLMGSGETEDYEITIQNGVNAVAENTLVLASVYPSPSNGLVNINLGTYAQKANVLVTDAVGRTVVVTNIKDRVATIDLSKFNNGVYFVTLTDNDNTITRKIVLNK